MTPIRTAEESARAGLGVWVDQYTLMELCVARQPGSGARTKHTIQLRKGEKMPTMEIVRAWKDEEYRDTLTIEQRAQLPAHPSGVIEFGEPQLEDESLFGPEAGSRCKYLSNIFSGKGNCSTSDPGHCK